MSTPNERSDVPQPPSWAARQAADELYDVEDQTRIAERAWEIVRDAEEREGERHDEYDDPDQGGEA